MGHQESVLEALLTGIVLYFLVLRLDRRLALHIERQFFGQDAFAAEGQERARAAKPRSVDDHVRRLGEQLMPLLDRTNRMFIRNLKAIKELRQGLVPAIAIARADQVTVTSPQTGRGRLRPVKRVVKPSA